VPLKIFKSITQCTNWINKQKHKTIGLVPTMGALHQGHLSLVRASKKECQITIVSIFVNKMQFAPHEDFKQYPRDLKLDIQLLKNEKVDVIFYPKSAAMYKKNFAFKVEENNIAYKLEGKSRPDFFSGVTTVVCKLFNIVQPSKAYFGQKDMQQLIIIKKMVKELNFPIKIKGCPTIRAANGLAMSSRNQYLTETGLKDASIIYQTLLFGAKKIKQKKQSIKTIKQKMKLMLNHKEIKIDYISIADLNSFNEIKKHEAQTIIISVALWYQNVRLIDNIIIPRI